MNRRLNKIVVTTCAAFTMSLGIGCGDMPESPAGANLPIAEEASAQSYAGMNFNLNLPESVERPTINHYVNDAQIIEAIGQIEGPADWPTLTVTDHLGEGFADGITQGEPEEENQNEEFNDEDNADEEPLVDGFADGDATSREWKELAWGVCRDDVSELTGFKVTNAAGTGLYHAARFACTFVDDSNDTAHIADYAAFVLGDASSCKTYETFKSHAEQICGMETEIVEKKVFGLCAESGGERMYRTALFACKKPQN
jgi:hypothetical protein